MKLGVVGHAAEKFDARTEAAARQAIAERVAAHKATRIVSGRSPMGGVDIYAEEIAADLNLPVTIHLPRRHSWFGGNGPTEPPVTRGRETVVRHPGFRSRNLGIAHDSDRVLVVVVERLPEGYTGMRFATGCYHCRGRNPEHVKSGGCWTGWQALAAGREAEWVVVR